MTNSSGFGQTEEERVKTANNLARTNNRLETSAAAQEYLTGITDRTGGTGSLTGVSGTLGGGTGTGGTFALTKDAGTYTIALEDKTYTGLIPTYAGNVYTATTWDITVLNGAYTVHTVNTSGTGHIVNDKLEISGGSFVNTNGVIIAAKKNIPPIIKANKKIPVTSKVCKLLIVSSSKLV